MVTIRWRTERWDSLCFLLPNRWLELPGKAFSGTDPDGFTHHSDVLRFIVDYAAEIAAPVRTGVDVARMNEELRYKDEAAAGYDRAFAHVTTHFVPYFLRAARIEPGLRVLDIAGACVFGRKFRCLAMK